MKFSTLTRITVPAAMVVFLTIEITQQQQAAGWIVYVIAAAAFLSSIGIELWGITAGENLKKAWANGAGKASTAVQMIAYVAVAGWMLRTNDTLLVLPLVAALAYVASAWADGYQEAEQKTTERSAWEQGQEEKDREFQRQLEAKRLEADTAVKLARVEAKAVTSTRQEVRHDSGNLPADWRQLTRQQKHKIAHATREEREEMMPELADRTRREWHKRADKIAAQNGHFVV